MLYNNFKTSPFNDALFIRSFGVAAFTGRLFIKLPRYKITVDKLYSTSIFYCLGSIVISA
jgi:hypothetical protein